MLRASKPIVATAIAITAIFSAPTSFAQQGYTPSCWVISDMQGAAFLQGESYVPEHTTMDVPITLILNGDNSSISTPDMKVQQVDDFMALVYSASYSATNFEVFQIDPSAGLVLFTKNMRVKGSLSVISGITALVGSATKCQ